MCQLQGASVRPALGKLRGQHQHASKTSLVRETTPHLEKGLGPIPQTAATFAFSVLFSLKCKYYSFPSFSPPPVKNTNAPTDSSLTEKGSDVL